MVGVQCVVWTCASEEGGVDRKRHLEEGTEPSGGEMGAHICKGRAADGRMSTVFVKPGANPPCAGKVLGWRVVRR